MRTLEVSQYYSYQQFEILLTILAHKTQSSLIIQKIEKWNILRTLLTDICTIHEAQIAKFICYI